MSVGGGAVLSETNRSAMRSAGTVVWLRARPAHSGSPGRERERAVPSCTAAALRRRRSPGAARR